MALTKYITLAASPTALRKISIEKVVGMPFWAMGFDSIVYTCLPSRYVCRLGHRLKMSRIDTSAIAAEMVKLESVRDGADQHGVGKSVSKDMLIKPEKRISPFIDSASPQPAGSSLVDMFPKPLFWWLPMVWFTQHSKTLQCRGKPIVQATGLRLAPEGSGAL